MHVREEAPADIPHVHALNCAAFESSTEARIVDALRGQPDVISLVAEEDGHVVGHIMFSPVRLRGADDVRAMALAPMAVAPARQRAGIGSALVRDGLARCRELGVDALFVVGHPEYYPRFGFSRRVRPRNDLRIRGSGRSLHGPGAGAGCPARTNGTGVLQRGVSRILTRARSARAHPDPSTGFATCLDRPPQWMYCLPATDISGLPARRVQQVR